MWHNSNLICINVRDKSGYCMSYLFGPISMTIGYRRLETINWHYHVIIQQIMHLNGGIMNTKIVTHFKRKEVFQSQTNAKCGNCVCLIFDK